MPLAKEIKFLGGCIAQNANRSCSLRWITRSFSSKKVVPSNGIVNVRSDKIVTHLPPLDKPIPNLSNVIYATPDEKETETRVTNLSNGLTVASEKRFGQFCTVGVVIDYGSRYERKQYNGVSHFLEKLAFGSTSLFSNKEEMLQLLEKHSGICDCQSSRDTFVYATSVDIRGLDAVTKILGEVVLRPQLNETEVETARETVKFELETLHSRPEQETLLMDMIHKAAYGDATLGLPKLCPMENTDTLDRNKLITYLKAHYTPNRIVLAGAGVEHEALIDYAQKYFVDAQPMWQDNSEFGSLEPDKSKAVYTGGYVIDESDVPLYPGSDLPELSHVVIGLESCSHQDPDFIAMCVLNTMMGGGGSFSAGGPGKGMFTRLYTNVLNRHHWMFSATAYNQAYADGGLFCIHASSSPAKIGDTCFAILKELRAMAGDVTPSELSRAKAQLKSMLLMNLEARPVVFEDIGRQVLATGHRKPPSYFIEAIDAISESDIKRVALRLLSSVPCVAARGKLKSLPDFKQIQSELISPKSRRLSLFR